MKRLYQVTAVLFLMAFMVGTAQDQAPVVYAEEITYKNLTTAPNWETVVAVATEVELVASDEVEPDEPLSLAEEIIIPEEPAVSVQNGYISPESLWGICTEVGQIYQMSPALLYALAEHESGLCINAIGSCGDSGLCQIIPKYHHKRISRLGVTDIFDPYSNVLVAADFLAEVRDTDADGEDIAYVLLVYNMGQANAHSVYHSGTTFYQPGNYAYDILTRTYEIEQEQSF